jgi:hypothetical protein
MLSYYVEWHMRKAWTEITFADPGSEITQKRNPVAPAEKSEQAKM